MEALKAALGVMNYIEGFDVRIDRAAVLRALNFKAGDTEVIPNLNRLLYEAEKISLPLIEPKGVFSIFDLESTGIHAPFFHGKYISLSLLTIGDRLEETVDRMMKKGEAARAVIIDTMGSHLVEGFASFLNRRIDCEVTKMGLYTKRRVSPGYGRWPIQDQKKIFSLLDWKWTGVTLNNSFQMFPLKSISFGIDIGDAPPNSGMNNNPCTACGLKDCPFRR